MQPLDHLRVKLMATGEDCDDARAVVEALHAELRRRRPRFLADARGKWSDPYLTLELVHADGTVLTVTHGDGYTAVVGAGVNYHSYLDEPSLIAVLVGALRGDVTYVCHSRFGLKAAEYFELRSCTRERVGRRAGLVGGLQFLLGLIPMVPKSVRRTRVTFEATPADAPT